MGLNLKNHATEKMVRELARLTGESLTLAVKVAARERLDRTLRSRGPSLANRLVAVGKDCAVRLKDAYRTMEHDGLLYDEHELPR